MTAPVINMSDLNMASGDTSRLFSLGIKQPNLTLSEFVKQLDRDISGMRAVFPKGEICMTGDVYEYFVNNLIDLGSAAIEAGRQLSQTGLRQFVKSEYSRVANDLNRDLSGSLGLSAMLKSLLDLKTEADARGVTLSQSTICVSPKNGVDLHKRIFFSLGRIKIAVETYIELEGFVPWFADNFLANYFFDALFAIGETSVAIVKAIKAPIDNLNNLFNNGRKAAEEVKEIVKIVSIAGAFAYAMYTIAK